MSAPALSSISASFVTDFHGRPKPDSGGLYIGDDIATFDCPGAGKLSEDIARACGAHEAMLSALKLALEYWGHRQQRYRNRHPVWVEAAREAISKAEARP